MLKKNNKISCIKKLQVCDKVHLHAQFEVDRSAAEDYVLCDMMLYYWENNVRMLGGPHRVIEHCVPNELNPEYDRVSFRKCKSSCVCRQSKNYTL